MSRRVFLHVGVMKSATGDLQDLCDANRDRLLAQGLLWAKSGANFLATDDLLGTRRVRPGLDGAWRRLADQIEAHDGDALLSNELSAPINPASDERLVQAARAGGGAVVMTVSRPRTGDPLAMADRNAQPAAPSAGATTSPRRRRRRQ